MLFLFVDVALHIWMIFTSDSFAGGAVIYFDEDWRNGNQSTVL